MIYTSVDQIPLMRYGVILADPPWHFQLRSADPAVPYRTMTTEAIASMPVGHFAARDCALLLWGTSPMLPQALQVMAAWGFEFKGKAFCWAKTCKNRPDWPASDRGTWHMGRGYSTRANTEDCWLGIMGQPQRLSFGVRELITDPVARHSQKPETVYDRSVALYGGPYLDLFSRQERAGWDQFGDQVEALAC